MRKLSSQLMRLIKFIMNSCSNCDRLDVLVFKVPAATRQSAKMKVDQLKYDIRHLQVCIKLSTYVITQLFNFALNPLIVYFRLH